MATASAVQVAFRGRDDSQTLDSSTFTYSQNTNWSQAVDTIFRVRFEVEEVNSKLFSVGGQLQYNINGAGWNSVTASSSVVKAVASAQFADGDATTNILTVSAKTFTAGTGSEDGLASSVNLNNTQTELEYSIEIVGADVSSGDTVELRVASLTSWTVAPSITVLKNLTINKSEGVTLGETWAVTLPDSLSISKTDNLTSTDVVTDIAVVTYEEPDRNVNISTEPTITLGEAVSAVLPDALFAIATDTVAATDAVFEGKTYPQISVSDNIAASDIVTDIDVISMADYEINRTESVTVGEVGSASIPDNLSVSKSENVTTADVVINVSVSSLPDFEIDTSDNVFLYEPSFVDDIRTISRTDTIAVAEITAISMPDDLTINKIDAVAVAETKAVSIQDNLLISKTESTITVGETVSVLLDDLSIPKSENVIIGESIGVSIQDALVVTKADGVTLGENSTQALADIAISKADAITLGESQAITLSDAEISRSDGVTLADAVSASITTEVSKSEGVTLGDALTADLRAAWYNPDILAVNVGSVVAGTVEDTWSDNGVKLQLSEVTGTPGFDYDFIFYNVPADAYSLTINGYYQGNPGHNVKAQQYNFTTEAWTNLSPDTDDFPSTTSDQDYQFALFGGVNYNSGGEVRIKIIHTTAGTNTHNLYIDQMLMSQQTLVVHIPDEDLLIGEIAELIVSDALVSVSDTLTVGESFNVNIEVEGEYNVSVSDTLAVGEFVSLISESLAIDVSDGLTLGESLSIVSADLEIDETGSAALGENIIVLHEAASIDAQDTLAVQDISPTIQLLELSALSVSASDQALVEDAFLLLIPDAILVAGEDAVAVSDTTNEQLSEALVNVSDDALVNDAVDVSSVTLSIETADTTTVVDVQPDVQLPEIGAFSVSVEDGISVSDVALSKLPDDMVVDSSDTTSVADSVVIDPIGISLTQSENVVPADATTNVVILSPEDFVVTTSDATLVGEAVAISLSDISIATSDTVATNETYAIAEQDLFITSTDSTLLGEYYVTIADRSLSVSDNLFVNETTGQVLPDDLTISVSGNILLGENVYVVREVEGEYNVIIEDGIAISEIGGIEMGTLGILIDPSVLSLWTAGVVIE